MAILSQRQQFSFTLVWICCMYFMNIRHACALSSRAAHPKQPPRSHQTSPPLSRSSSQRQKVAIIGGGIAGLSCAQQLVNHSKYQVTVFDTGRLRPGGRCASRLPNDVASKKDAASPTFPILSQYCIDHAAQINDVETEKKSNEHLYGAFQKQVCQWKERGILKEFPKNSLVQIQVDKHGVATSIEPVASSSSSSSYLHAPQGMGSIPISILNAIESVSGNDDGKFVYRQDVWVSPSNGLRYLNQTRDWQISSNGKSLGRFDQVIIAHNGKCADRLTSATPAKLINNLLKVKFAPTTTKKSQRMTLNSIYSLSFALPRGSNLSKRLASESGSPFMCGMIQKHPSLSFLTCQTNKLQQPAADCEHEIWTILSTANFASQHKAPQEFLPQDVIANVSKLLINSLEECLGMSQQSIHASILEHRLQLWGAALPLNVYQSGEDKRDGFLWDGKFQIGVCGDWLMEPSIRGAWTSGLQLGRLLTNDDRRDNAQSKQFKGAFYRSDAAAEAGIGAFDLPIAVAER
ncbi:hypothetical protein MPSEU_000582100 [Mayamaea pseudoterrestris]|nr:hypothetical protein MPSEU_000582100 [Mayamaea pseudoterrestris]